MAPDQPIEAPVDGMRTTHAGTKLKAPPIAFSGASKGDAARAVDALCNVITDALSRGEEVRLVGFGIFSVVERSGRMGRNPGTGADIYIPESRQPKFRAGKQLKNAVNR